MRDLGIEFISVFGLPPVDFVHLAADLGCRYISTGLTSKPLETLGYPPFSLKDDLRLRRQVLAALDDRGVSISLGEGMVIVPHADVSNLAPDLDVMAETRGRPDQHPQLRRGPQPYVRPTGDSYRDVRRAEYRDDDRTGPRYDDR
jgi:hypothetical protein